VGSIKRAQLQHCIIAETASTWQLHFGIREKVNSRRATPRRGHFAAVISKKAAIFGNQSFENQSGEA